MAYITVKKEKTDEFYHVDMPVYNIMTGDRYFVCLNIRELNPIFVHHHINDNSEDEITLICTEEECNKLEQLYFACFELEAYEYNARKKFLAFLEAGHYAEAVEYFKEKSMLVQELSFAQLGLDGYNEIINDIHQKLKTMLKLPY